MEEHQELRSEDEHEENVVKSNNYSLSEKGNLFNNEFYPHITSMYNFAYRLSFDEDDAKDLVQETYLKAYRFINSFQQGTNAKAWLFRILKNSFINEFRKKSKEPSKVDYQEVETFYNSDEVDEPITTDLRVDSLQHMIGDEVTTALNSLAVDFRTVIILCDLEDFTYEEFTDSVKWLEEILEEYRKKKDPGWEMENLGVPNSLLRVRGYGLFSQKHYIELKLENAKLKGLDQEVLEELEELLITSDIGVQTTMTLIERLSKTKVAEVSEDDRGHS